MKKEQKTNAMRILDKNKITYKVLHYDIAEEEFSGVNVAKVLGINPDMCYKTLCLKSTSNIYYIFCIDVASELDLKKCARAVGEKKLELVSTKLLKDIVGYERGSVSPIGTKKAFKVIIDEKAKNFEEIKISAGAKGCSLVAQLSDIVKVTRAEFFDIAFSV